MPKDAPTKEEDLKKITEPATTQSQGNPFDKFIAGKDKVGQTVRGREDVSEKAPHALEKEGGDDTLPDPTKTVHEAPKKNPGYIEKTKAEAKAAKEEAEKAKKEAEELRLKNQEYEKSLKEFEEKLSSATNNEEFQKIQKELEAERQRNEKLNEEFGGLKKKEAFRDLTEDDEFQRDYVEPLSNAWKATAKIIGSDKDAMMILEKIGNANQAAFNATDEESRFRFEDQRDQLIGQIVDGLPTYKQQRFSAAINDMIAKTEKHVEALANWQNVRQTLAERKETARREAQKAIKTRWTEAYEQAGTKLAADLTISDDLKTVMEGNKVILDPARDEAIAQAIITGTEGYQTEDMAQVIRQGAAFPVAVAKIKGLEAMVKELRGTISELRGEGTSGNLETNERDKNGNQKEDEKAEKFWGKYAARS